MEINRKVVELSVEDILPNRFQPRIKFSDTAINELSESIKEHGVIQPIVVRPVGDRYEIIAGERRYKATVLAGLSTIPAIITDLNDKDSAEVALIENVQRQDLTPIEEAISYKKILDMGYLTQEELAEKLGKNQSTVANKLRLLNLDEDVQEALLNEKISERHARSLLKLSDHQDQLKLLNKIINERLTVRKTDEEISKMINEKTEPTGETKNIEILDFDEPIMIPSEEISTNSFSNLNIGEENLSFNIPTSPIIENIPAEPVNSFPDFSFTSLTSEDEKSETPKFRDLLQQEQTQNEEPTIVPGKFFNILEETSQNTDNVQETQNSDFSEVTIPKEPVNNINSFNISPNFGIPNFDDSLFNQTQSETINNDIDNPVVQETVGSNTYVTSNIKTVVNTIRNCADTIEKYGFQVDTEEFDLEDMYQVVFKVYKNK